MSTEKDEDEFETWILKFAVLGDAGVGKTSLINQFVDKTFKEDYRATIGANIVKKTIKLPELKSIVNLVLWDIAGQEKYQKSISSYYEGCSGAIFVYDITRYSSFDNITSKWYKDYDKHVSEDQEFILIGNKNDLVNQRGVNNNNGQTLANRLNAIEFIETSAKTGNNVNKAFTDLTEHIIRARK
ncbi:MAG: GTP-binding protein [Promethearchaeota archaeon]|nr:MAG: GTP-binding protein [Candidatus Lokiarchaeota archaeon]